MSASSIGRRRRARDGEADGERAGGEARRAWRDALPPWARGLLGPVVAVVEDVFAERLESVAPGLRRRADVARPPTFAPVRRRRLPFDLFLATGSTSHLIFPAGAIDDLCFVQRTHASQHHDIEYLTRLAPEDAGSESFKAYGIFRLRRADAEPLPDLERAHGFWERLRREHGLDAIPDARAFLPRAAAAPGAADLAGAPVEAVRLAPRGSAVFREVAGLRFQLADMLEVIRREMSGPEKVAWVEHSFAAAPDEGAVVHRYYLDGRTKQAYLVRHHALEGKRFFRAITSDEARALCEASGVLQRSAAARRLAA